MEEPAHLPWEKLVAYWAGDLASEEEEAAELHLMGCGVCSDELGRVAAVTEAVRAQPAAAAAPGPVLTVVQGERRDAAPARPQRRQRWFLGGAGVATLAAAAFALFLLVPRGASVVTLHLPPPVRDTVAVELAPPAGAREVRLLPELGPGMTANAARLRRLEGGWPRVRVEAGPPFAVVAELADLPAGGYELELVSVAPDGHEESRGFYRFRVTQ